MNERDSDTTYCPCDSCSRISVCKDGCDYFIKYVRATHSKTRLQNLINFLKLQSTAKNFINRISI